MIKVRTVPISSDIVSSTFNQSLYNSINKGVEGSSPKRLKSRSKLYNTLDYADVYITKERAKGKTKAQNGNSSNQFTDSKLTPSENIKIPHVKSFKGSFKSLCNTNFMKDSKCFAGSRNYGLKSSRTQASIKTLNGITNRSNKSSKNMMNNSFITPSKSINDYEDEDYPDLKTFDTDKRYNRKNIYEKEKILDDFIIDGLKVKSNYLNDGCKNSAASKNLEKSKSENEYSRNFVSYNKKLAAMTPRLKTSLSRNYDTIDSCISKTIVYKTLKKRCGLVTLTYYSACPI